MKLWLFSYLFLSALMLCLNFIKSLGVLWLQFLKKLSFASCNQFSNCCIDRKKIKIIVTSSQYYVMVCTFENMCFALSVHSMKSKFFLHLHFIPKKPLTALVLEAFWILKWGNTMPVAPFSWQKVASVLHLRSGSNVPYSVNWLACVSM